MEIKIISYKLLFISIIISSLFIIFQLLLQKPFSLLQLTTCNEQGTLTSYIRYLGKDIVINPSSLKNISYCMGKSMPFYDRTIDFLINPTVQIENELKARYNIANVINDNNILIGKYNFIISSKSIRIQGSKETVEIFKRQLNSPFNLYSNGPIKGLRVIRPVSSDSIEPLLKNDSLEQQSIPNGESYKVNIVRL